MADEEGPLLRSEDLWYNDGTLVIQADRTLFRVHGGLLGTQSSKFHDILSNLPPSQEKYDGCPLVVVEESAGEMERLLTVMDDVRWFNRYPVANFTDLEHILLLGDIYGLKGLPKQLISIILSKVYPSSLDHWLSRKPPKGYKEMERDDFEVLALAKAYDIDFRPLLPGIYYECCRYPIATIGDANISRADQKKCLTAMTTFDKDWARGLYTFLFRGPSGPSGCRNSFKCGRARQEWIKDNRGLPVLKDVFSAPFEWKEIDLCKVCLKSAKEIYKAGRVRLWDALPSLFELPPWEELLAAK
ncbi:hypothetical protein B0H11DRAFT_2209946 [Mycena galericulata]|nr:hypothetical protein B0H11DRAFT_2209946 [Mycena galericulata]